MIFTTITGVISVFAFLLTLHEKFEHWKKYLIYISIFFGGFFVGHVSFSMLGLESVLGNERAIVNLIVVIFLLILVGAIEAVLLKKDQIQMVYVIFILSVSMFIPTFVKKIDDVIFDSYRSTSDYLIIAEYYENREEFEESIAYYELYRDSNKTAEIKDSINKKIEILKHEWSSSITSSK